jgi:uncharacterized protein (DUF2236 family)
METARLDDSARTPVRNSAGAFPGWAMAEGSLAITILSGTRQKGPVRSWWQEKPFSSRCETILTPHGPLFIRSGRVVAVGGQPSQAEVWPHRRFATAPRRQRLLRPEPDPKEKMPASSSPGLAETLHPVGVWQRRVLSRFGRTAACHQNSPPEKATTDHAQFLLVPCCRPLGAGDPPLMPRRPWGGLPSLLPAPLARPIKQAIAAQVVALFNDRTRGEAPVMRRMDGLFGPKSAAWRVHGDVASMMVGGISGLLLQMLHPAVLAGVWDHSNFRADMHGRLRRTARFIALTTYGGRAEAEAVIARVRGIHGHVGGTLPDGTPYSANDPALLAWVHVTETTSFLQAWLRYGEPGMTGSDQDRYYAEMAQIAAALGADPIPRSRAEARQLIEAMRPELRVDARTREVARLMLNQPAPSKLAEPLQALAMQAGIDLLPVWARRMHGLQSPVLSRPLVRAGTLGIAETLRWSFGRRDAAPERS